MKKHLWYGRVIGISLLSFFFLLGIGPVQAQKSDTANEAQGSPQLSITGDVQRPLSLSLDDLRALPRKAITVKNEHADEEETYDGTSLAVLLKQAGAPQGAQLRGKTMATYVLAEGSDGYRVIFSLAELDADFQNSDVLVAYTLNGKSLGEKFGPLRLVVPNDKRPARWVRMLRSIQVVNVAK